MSASPVSASSKWFVSSVARPRAAATLFCLPYAGGAASAFRTWRSVESAAVDPQPIQLPGRETRIGEPARVDPVEIADALVDRIDRPYAIYGHSMGARVGFEVVRELRRRGAPLPARFYIGGARPPDTVDPVARIGRRSDDAFIQGLEELGGTPAGVFDFPELRELLLPVLRADFQWLDAYRYRPEAPLPVPMVAFAGQADPVVRPELMVGWSRHTSGAFRLHTVPGNHFFLHTEASRMLQMITADLVGGAPASDDLAPPQPDEVHVWFVDLDEWPELRAAIDELGPAETARAARYSGDTERGRYIGRHVLLKRMLRRYGVDTDTDTDTDVDIDVDTAPPGAGPRTGRGVHRPSGIHVSLDHQAGLVLIGFARDQKIGIGIERIRPLADLEAFRETGPDFGERVTHLALAGALGAVAVTRPDWRLRFEAPRPDNREVQR